MYDYILSYQMLMKAVRSVTGASNSIFPHDYNYVAIPLSSVQSVLESFNPGSWSPEINDSDGKARKLWYMLKEEYPRLACGIVRLSAPAAHDLVGVITVEDVSESKIKKENISTISNFRKDEILTNDLLNDDISEYQETSILQSTSSTKGKNDQISSAISSGTSSLKTSSSNNDTKEAKEPSNAEIYDEDTKVPEMTLIEPYTKQIFKKSWGGTFGVSSWQVSEIKALAVWF